MIFSSELCTIIIVILIKNKIFQEISNHKEWSWEIKWPLLCIGEVWGEDAFSPGWSVNMTHAQCTCKLSVELKMWDLAAPSRWGAPQRSLCPGHWATWAFCLSCQVTREGGAETSGLAICQAAGTWGRERAPPDDLTSKPREPRASQGRAALNPKGRLLSCADKDAKWRRLELGLLDPLASLGSQPAAASPHLKEEGWDLLHRVFVSLPRNNSCEALSAPRWVKRRKLCQKSQPCGCLSTSS